MYNVNKIIIDPTVKLMARCYRVDECDCLNDFVCDQHELIMQAIWNERTRWHEALKKHNLIRTLNSAEQVAKSLSHREKTVIEIQQRLALKSMCRWCATYDEPIWLEGEGHFYHARLETAKGGTGLWQWPGNKKPISCADCCKYRCILNKTYLHGGKPLRKS